MRIPLANLFVQSPLPRISKLMERVVECSAAVPELIEHLVAGDQDAVIRHAKEVSRLEGLADDAKNAVREHMPVRLFLPVDRRDVLTLIGQIDAIADSAEDVGVLLTLRKMEVPDLVRPLLPGFVDRVLDCVTSASELVDTLDPLLAHAFSGKAARQAETIIHELARKEHEADKVQDQLAKTVFGLEGEMEPVAMFMWLKIFEELGDMANHAENVGDQFRLFIAR